MTYGEILFRTVTSFIALLVLTRLLGKKQVGHLTFVQLSFSVSEVESVSSIMVAKLPIRFRQDRRTLCLVRMSPVLLKYSLRLP